MAAGAVLIGTGLGLNVLGGMRSSRAMRREARLRQEIAGINAQQRVAAGQQAAFEEERQARLAQSRALALAAASGASPSGGSSERVIADVGAEGAYRAALQVYAAKEDARVIRLTGDMEASSLRSQARAARFGAAADLFSGVGSMYAKYGNNGPDVEGAGTD